jgi:hypothetical protein
MVGAIKGKERSIYGFSFLPLFVFLALGLLFFKASKRSWKLILTKKKQGIELFLKIGGELNRREYKLGVQKGERRETSRLVRLECMNLVLLQYS